MPVFNGFRAVIVLACVLGFAASARADDKANWDTTVAAARAEGKVVVYNAGTPAFLREIGNAFQKKYGVAVDVLDGRSSEIRERIRAEHAAGKVAGDVTHTSSNTASEQAAMELLQPHGFLPKSSAVIAPLKDDGVQVPVLVSRLGILVNTDLVKSGDEPATWRDLLAPKWKGKILSDDPRANGGTYQAFIIFDQVLGRDFHESLARQDLTFMRENRVAERRVARGEFPIYIMSTISGLINLKGLPVKVVIPAEGAPYLVLVNAMLRNAPHPNAGRLFLNFFLEDEAQEIVQKFGYGSATGASSDALDASIRPLLQSKLLGTPTLKQQMEMLPVFQSIYK